MGAPFPTRAASLSRCDIHHERNDGWQSQTVSAHIEFLYRLFAQSGFRDPHIPWFASMIKNYIYSFVEEENRLTARAEAVESADTTSEPPATHMKSLSAEHYSHFVRLLPYTTAVNWDEEFLFGLKVLVDGFEA
ncbi:TetR/AcrR family transcriptional regulator C-terminal domain-containing protein [Paenibacillus oryzisoli]|uniref:Tetracycline repressor TetR C-terminal domain-containing protein n=1 Tax=Paenibacillus oryzisoli TaxID=1850517 RepID=A0A198AJ07_9BACL|nr:TetR/AcrR family transcriptional regulator C-terminal domain-containing protein [Paenibacillus oryzisoli]OAS21060.1 hypothetical protein A8708_29645 [Paenibacillus oryzisoli]